MCPKLIHSSGTLEGLKTLPRNLHWLSRTVRPEGHILEKILNLEIYLLGRRVFVFYSSHTSIKMCPKLIHSSGTPEGPKTLPRNLHWLLRTVRPEGNIFEKIPHFEFFCQEDEFSFSIPVTHQIRGVSSLVHCAGLETHQL